VQTAILYFVSVEMVDSSVGDSLECQHFHVVSLGTEQTSADGWCPDSADHELLMLRKELNDARAHVKKIVRVISRSALIIQSYMQQNINKLPVMLFSITYTSCG